MSHKRALKSELAGAALAIGVLSAAPSFADEPSSEAVADSNRQVISEQDGGSFNVVQNIDPYNPIVPDGVLWGLAGLIALSGAYRIAKKKDGALSRTLAMATGAAVLMQPEIIAEKRLVEPTEFLIFVDKSESQELDGREELTHQAYAALESKLQALDYPVHIRAIEFGGDAEDKPQDGTSLSQVMKSNLDALPDGRLGAAFVLSDGRIQDIDAALDIQGIDAPVHALITGRDDEVDFALQIEAIPRFGLIEDESAQMAIRVHSEGVQQHDDLSFVVTVANNGEYVTQYAMPANQTMNVKLPQIYTGKNNIELEISRIHKTGNGEPYSAVEVTQDNNKISATVQGIEDNTKVLLLSGDPYQGTAQWRDVLSRDAAIDFSHFAYMRPAHKEDATPLRDLATIAFPVHEVLNERIDEYDVIVFDARSYSGEIPFAYLDKIKDFVNDGGGLIMVGADDLVAENSLTRTSLGEILPIVPTNQVIKREYIPQISDVGVRHPLGRALGQAHGDPSEWGPWHNIANITARANGQVLLTDQMHHPLLTIAKQEEGRVAVLASDQGWLWASGYKGGGPAFELERNLVLWASGHEGFDDENVMIRHEGEQLIIDLQTMGDQSEELILTAPSGATIKTTPEEFAPGLRRAFVPAAEVGVYKIERTGTYADHAFAEVGFADRLEMIGVVSETQYIEPFTRKNNGITARMMNGGGDISIPDLQVVENSQTTSPEYMAVKKSNVTALQGTERRPLIPDWLALALSLGLFAYGLKSEGGKSWKKSLFGSKRNTNSEPPAPGL